MPPAPANSEPLIRNEQTMKYRPLGKTGLFVSALAFGCMRLEDNPELNGRLLPRAVELGVNYFETTRMYLDGTCQHRVGPAIKGKTGGVIVSGKAAIGANVTAFGLRKEMELQLEILGLSHFKFFQIGWLRWTAMAHLLKRGGALDAIRRAQDEGLIQRIGFTGHDLPENVIKMMETGIFDCVTVPYNMLNRVYEPAIKRAGELGVGVIAMCPVAGGILNEPAKLVHEALGDSLPTPSVALQFVLSNPDISAACSGMSTVEMLEQNVAAVGSFTPDAAKFKAMCDALDALVARMGHKFCTGCNYCSGCAQKLNLVQLMEAWQLAKAFDLRDWAREKMKTFAPERRPDRCTTCGVCETKCPNSINIRERLKELTEMTK